MSYWKVEGRASLLSKQGWVDVLGVPSRFASEGFVQEGGPGIHRQVPGFDLRLQGLLPFQSLARFDQRRPLDGFEASSGGSEPSQAYWLAPAFIETETFEGAFVHFSQQGRVVGELTGLLP